MSTWMGRALIAASAAGSTYGLYLWLGTAPALVYGSLIAYVAGYHLATRKRGDEAQARFEDVHERVSESIREARNAAAVQEVEKAKHPRRREVN